MAATHTPSILAEDIATKQVDIGGGRMVIAPAHWSDKAVRITGPKYLSPGDDDNILKMIHRVTSAIANAGLVSGHMSSALQAREFADILSTIVLNQEATWNSPVWFNVGVAKEPQCWACLIIGVSDYMVGPGGIQDWIDTESQCFLGGSGSGANISNIRADREPLRGGKGLASGPISFMRWADSGAGAIKSGGTTRRAAKMVILDADHPDIEEFVASKARVERMKRVLNANGFDVTLNGADESLVQYQNANNSVRVTDDFMKQASDPAAIYSWELIPRIEGMDTSLPRRSIDPASLWRGIAEAAWECGDPGLQFHDTINRWHTAPSRGPIRGSNPCSEYMHVDDSVCNLASLNLVKFLREMPDSSYKFDTLRFQEVVSSMITSMDILVSLSSYPNDRVKKNAHDLRNLGLGFANLGALLMSLGIPYDSVEGRSAAAGISTLMMSSAVLRSTQLAEELGPHAAWKDDSASHLAVLRSHRDEARVWFAPSLGGKESFDAPIWHAADRVWSTAIASAEHVGVRNAQHSVIAPTGTIGFQMDCETTGIEPAVALAAKKYLVGDFGSSIDIGVVHCLRRGIDTIRRNASNGLSSGLTDEQIIAQNPKVFATAIGTPNISVDGHLRMMAAVQPSISGAISKTVNMPETSTAQDVARVYIEAWMLGLKAVAVYRDNSKSFQIIDVNTPKPTLAIGSSGRSDVSEQSIEEAHTYASRAKLPKTTIAIRHKFDIAGHEFYAHVGFYEDGRMGELFLKSGVDGSFSAGMTNMLSIALSIGLQHGVPLEAFADKFIHQRFDPQGMVQSDSHIKMAGSVVDYLFRWLMEDGTEEDGRIVRKPITLQRMMEKMEKIEYHQPQPEHRPFVGSVVGEECPDCHKLSLVWDGKCRTCMGCGYNEGCAG